MDYPIRLADQLRAHLRSLRKQRGLTQAQLGQRLGIGQVRMAEIEAKPGLVGVDQLVKLLSALGAGLVVRDLEGRSDSPVAGPVPEPASAARVAGGCHQQRSLSVGADDRFARRDVAKVTLASATSRSCAH